MSGPQEDPRLTQIRALCDENEKAATEYRDDKERRTGYRDVVMPMIYVDEVRAILDAPPVAVTPPQDDGSPLMPPETLMERMDADGRMFRLGVEAATPPQGIDRDALLALLRQVWSRDRTVDDAEVRILALVRPVPPQGIDRDALIADAMRMLYEHSPSVDHEYDREEAEELVDRMLLHGSYLTAAPDRDIIAAAIQTDFDVRNSAALRVADRILALVRPVEGVTEVDTDLLHDCAVVCQKHGLDGTARRLLGLAARLENDQ